MSESTQIPEISVQAKSLKDLTLGQVGDFAETLKKFWGAIAAAVAVGLVVFHYIAPQTELDKLSCAAEKRVLEANQRSTIVLLNIQLADRINQQATLLQIQSSLLEIEFDNKPIKLTLSPLKTKLDKLVTEAKEEIKQREMDLSRSQTDLKSATDAFAQCGSKK